MVIVDLKTGDVALVAGEDGGFSSDRGLNRKRLRFGLMFTLTDISLVEVR